MVETEQQEIVLKFVYLYRPFTIPRVLGGSPEPSDEEDEESEEDSSTTEENKAKTEEPEVDKALINRRQRGRGVQKKDEKEGEAATKGGQRGGPKGRGRGVSASDQKHRATNERNKGSRANHNRKAGAERKRMRGMGPLSQH